MISPGKSLFLQKVLKSPFPCIFPTGGLAILFENVYFIKKVIQPGGIVEKAFFPVMQNAGIRTFFSHSTDRKVISDE